ncbi:hypothetical protein [Chitinophaga sp. YR573]|uniref:hypothetical protein n=1 Tax=Chitinophaga sp. YR573 TaxID=1881040 RepID=UPI0015A5BD4F|nr:hypothetical protein [Chitinophaga sp. YR573]
MKYMRFLPVLLLLILGASCVPPRNAPRPPHPPRPPHGVQFNHVIERPVMV